MANPEHLAKLKEGVEAWNKWRNENRAVEPDLVVADLGGAILRSADLSGANLGSAALSGANLIGAHLNGANLLRAHLNGANLTGANLIGAHLTGAHVSGANLSGAFAGSTNWTDVDLSEVKNLASVFHQNPSSVGIDTLTKSKGRILDVFLRGCGLADWEIENAKLYDPDLSPAKFADIQYQVHHLRMRGPIQYFSVFISYSHADKQFACALHDCLQSVGVRCWLDEKQLLPGDDLHEQVDRGIRLWDKTILCASKASLTSWWVDKELTAVFAKEAELMRQRGKKVLALVPLNLDGQLFAWKNGKAEEVRVRYAPDFTAWKSAGFDMKKAVEPLVRALRADDGGREPPPAARL